MLDYYDIQTINISPN